MKNALNILLVDDETLARTRLRTLLADCAATLPTHVAGEAANGRKALELLNKTAVDVMLLDIRMPEMDGIEVAQHVQKLSQPPAIIFTTAYDDYAIRAFEVNAVDYLLKPIRAARLLHALQKAQVLSFRRLDALAKTAARSRTHLSVCEKGKIILVPVADVVYLRAELKYVTLRTAQREFLLEESLSKLEQEFEEQFVRIHRSCLVAKQHIRGFQKTVSAGLDSESTAFNWVVLLNGIEEGLPVGRRQQHVIKVDLIKTSFPERSCGTP
jgi:two-component system response regulator AlgR